MTDDRIAPARLGPDELAMPVIEREFSRQDADLRQPLTESQRRQFAQVMGIAQGVRAVGLPIRRPGIMHGNAAKVRQNANLIQRLPTPLGMYRRSQVYGLVAEGSSAKALVLQLAKSHLEKVAAGRAATVTASKIKPLPWREVKYETASKDLPGEVRRALVDALQAFKREMLAGVSG